MKKTNKKGFTIVELVIVIAVIAILAAVLIPTFTNVVKKAKISAAMQAAKNANTEYLASLDFTKVSMEDQDYYIQSGDYYFKVTDGTFDATETEGTAPTSSDVLNAENGVYTPAAAGTGTGA